MLISKGTDIRREIYKGLPSPAKIALLVQGQVLIGLGGLPVIKGDTSARLVRDLVSAS